MTPRPPPERGVDSSLSEFSPIARLAKMSREGLRNDLSADGNPSLAAVVKMSHALGLRLRFEAFA